MSASHEFFPAQRYEHAA